MTTLYKIIKRIIQNQKEKIKTLKGEFHPGEKTSLFSQMYAVENENLFI